MKTKAELDAEARPAPSGITPRTAAEQIEYDAGAELARTGQPLPAAASPATRQGYQGHVALRGPAPSGILGERRPVKETQADRTTVEQNEYEHGAYLARDGKPLPAAASAATRHGFQAVTESPSDPVMEQNDYDAGVRLARNAKRLPRSASAATRQGYHSEPDLPQAPDIDRSLETRRRAESGNTPIDTTPREQVPTEHQRTEAQRRKMTQIERDRLESAHTPHTPRTAAEQSEYDAGANLARAGQRLPAAATATARAGYQSVPVNTEPKPVTRP